MIRAIIVDDEQQSRNTLKKLITKFTANVHIIDEAYNVVSAVEVIREKKPELVFLDISMPDGNGFDALDICSNTDFEVVFTTAYSEYAIKAIRHNAMDYLLKPININELNSAVAKAVKRIQVKRELDDTENADTKMLAVPTIHGYKFIEKEDILYLNAKGAYTEIYLKDGSVYTCSQNLKHYESILPKGLFFRSHNSYLINISQVKYYNKGDGSYITMVDNTCVVLSRRKIRDFLKRFYI